MSEFDIKEALTIDEMKAEIDRLSMFYPIARGIMMFANINGLSKEDFYAILAYEALRSHYAIYKRYIVELESRSTPDP